MKAPEQGDTSVLGCVGHRRLEIPMTFGQYGGLSFLICTTGGHRPKGSEGAQMGQEMGGGEVVRRCGPALWR